MIRAFAAGMLIIAGSITAPLAVPAFAAEPLSASAKAHGATDVATAADRIGRAFASLSEAEIGPVTPAAATRTPKGDFAPACATAVWPDIEAACLVTANRRPAAHVSTVTAGYRVGATTTALVRMRSDQIARLGTRSLRPTSVAFDRRFPTR